MAATTKIDKLHPGDLVALRMRWNLYSYRLGIVVAQRSDQRLVLWTTSEGFTELIWNLSDAIIEVNESNVAIKGGRWSLTT